MTLVVGSSVDRSDDAALQLAGVLARTAGEDVVVATVTARGFPDPRADREYRQWVAGVVRAGQDAAVATLVAAGVDAVRTVTVEATSVPAGLVSAVREAQGSLLVLGPAATAPAGRFQAGSVTEHLLHSSPVPLALAPAPCPPADRLTRLSCAWAGTDRSRAALDWTRRAAAAWDVPVRLLTFAPEREPMLPSETGLHVERLVSGTWAGQAQQELDALAAAWTGPGAAPETLVAGGRGWAGAVAAVPWRPGDLLVLGSSRLGPLARVFLGSTATKIVRSAPVPVVLVPA
ncbi:universal stress protein [Geodermatophilus sabuli]|uniref:Universal stress protein n=1 Tax=Geodermatophilus sabuli TaxID=1564158 RepID=A0A7K3W2F3_9ACTN|nr:universal stress protein [Geodermatophilus sabuli]